MRFLLICTCFCRSLGSLVQLHAQGVRRPSLWAHIRGRLAEGCSLVNHAAGHYVHSPAVFSTVSTRRGRPDLSAMAHRPRERGKGGAQKRRRAREDRLAPREGAPGIKKTVPHSWVNAPTRWEASHLCLVHGTVAGFDILKLSRLTHELSFVTPQPCVQLPSIQILPRQEGRPRSGAQ